ncbi:MAG: leucine-rich repeat protein [Clostridia bacterium]|nr:leucine-rich repeat protein [Clostridia bacterium]
MRRILLLLLILCACACARGEGDIASGVCGENAFWRLTESGELLISGDGAISDYTLTGAPWYQYRASVTRCTVGEGITRAGTAAFNALSALQEISLPSGLLSVGVSAFRNCRALGGITLPETVTEIGDSAFYNCKSLKYARFPAQLVSLGMNAFHGCEQLSGVTLPETLTSLGSGAFMGCSSLKYANVPSEIRVLGTDTFNGCGALERVSLSEGLSEIGFGAFYSCASLTDVTLPASLTALGGDVFWGCSALGGVIEVSALDCTAARLVSGEGMYFRVRAASGLEFRCGGAQELYARGKPGLGGHVIVPDGVTHIEENAFSGAHIVSLALPASVAQLGAHALADCAELERLYVLGGSVVFDEDALEGASPVVYCFEASDAQAYSHAQGLETVLLTDPQQHVYTSEPPVPATHESDGRTGETACEICGAVLKESRVIPKGACAYAPQELKSIADGAFACSAFAQITLGENVTGLGAYAFRDCESLLLVLLPRSLAYISETAFEGCTSAVLLVYEGSCAETYAREKGLEYFLR